MAVSFQYTVDGFEFMVHIGLMRGGDGVVINPESYKPDQDGFFQALDKMMFLLPIMDDEVTLYQQAEQYSQPHYIQRLTKEQIDFALNTYPCDLLYPRNELLDSYIESIFKEVERRKQKAAKEQAKARSYPGYVYLLQSPTKAYKIGRTSNPKSRAKTFGVQLPFEVEFICLIQADDMRQLETELHQRFSDKRINGEWFALSPDDVDYMKGLARAQF